MLKHLSLWYYIKNSTWLWLYQTSYIYKNVMFYYNYLINHIFFKLHFNLNFILSLYLANPLHQNKKRPLIEFCFKTMDLCTKSKGSVPSKFSLIGKKWPDYWLLSIFSFLDLILKKKLILLKKNLKNWATPNKNSLTYHNVTWDAEAFTALISHI